MFGATLTEFDPASFGDPLALKVSWDPLRRSLLGYGSRKVVEPVPGRIELRPTFGAVAETIYYMIPGLLMLGIAVALGLGETPELGIPFAVVGFLVAIVPGSMLWRRLQPQVFDRGSGRYWAGSTAPAGPDGEASCRLQSIHALQILCWKPQGRGLAYRNELNLVLKDGSRTAVITVADLDNARQCAARLAQLSGWKVWDATDPLAHKPVSAEKLRMGKRFTLALVAVMALGAIGTVASIVQSQRDFAERERAVEAAMAEQARKREANSREFQARAERAEQARRAQVQAQAQAQPFGPNPGEDWEVGPATTRAPPPDAGRNRVENASFEADPRAAWHFDARGPAVTGDWSTTRAPAGARVLQVRPTQDSSGVWRSTTRYPIAPGTLHVLRAAARAEGGARAAVGATYFDAQGRKVGRHNCFCLDLPGGEWYSLDVTILDGRYPGATAVELELVGCPTHRAAGATSPVVDFDQAFFGAVSSASNNCQQQAGPADGAAPR